MFVDLGLSGSGDFKKLTDLLKENVFKKKKIEL